MCRQENRTAESYQSHEKEEAAFLIMLAWQNPFWTAGGHSVCNNGRNQSDPYHYNSRWTKQKGNKSNTDATKLRKPPTKLSIDRRNGRQREKSIIETTGKRKIQRAYTTNQSNEHVPGGMPPGGSKYCSEEKRNGKRTKHNEKYTSNSNGLRIEKRSRPAWKAFLANKPFHIASERNSPPIGKQA